MTMRPTFSYYGSKWRLAKSYPPPLEGVPLVEPFAGAAGYAHWWDDGKREVLLVDADPVVAALWEWFLAATPAEIMDLPMLDDGRVPEGLPEGAAAMIGWWCGYALARPRADLSPSIDWSCYMGKHWTPQTRAHVAGNRARMGTRWRFVRGNFAEASATVNCATWFVDPPYIGRAGGRYNTKFDAYDGLSTWCQALNGRVVVCEQDSATWLPFRYHAQHVGARTNAKVRQRSTEVVWTNEPWGLL